MNDSLILTSIYLYTIGVVLDVCKKVESHLAFPMKGDKMGGELLCHFFNTMKRGNKDGKGNAF